MAHVAPPKIHCPGVYAIQATGFDNFIKLGAAKYIAHRFADLSAQLPFEIKLLAFLPTRNFEEAEKIEKKLHARFVALRHAGEFFAGHECLIAAIRSEFPKLSPRFDQLTANLEMPKSFEWILPLGTQGDPNIKAFKFPTESRREWIRRLAGLPPEPAPTNAKSA